MSIFKKKTEVETPFLIKIAVVIQVLYLLGGFLRKPMINLWVWMPGVLIPVVIQLFVLIAIWNLRRWAVVVYVIMAVLTFPVGFTSPEGMMSLRVITALVIFRAIVIVPALIYWKRMS